jgi:hypothetical protein
MSESIVRTTLNSLNTGDPITDEGLKVTIPVLEQADETLKLINNPAYRLVHNDIRRNLDTLERYREARKQ